MKKTIRGFDIEKRELTKEEASRIVTWRRFRDFHHSAGEDFLDTFNLSTRNTLAFLGYLIPRHPEFCKDISDLLIKEYPCISDLYDTSNVDLYNTFGFCPNKGIDLIYVDFALFCNDHYNLQKEVNQELIQVDEYYNK